MRSGVSFPSYAADPTWAAVTGAWDAGNPVTNLNDLYRIRRVAKQTGTGALAFTFLFTATTSLQFMALAHHNAAAADTCRLRLFSTTDLNPGTGTIVHDSTALPMFPSGSAPSALYPQVYPYRISAPVSCRGGRIDLTANGGSVPWVIGGVELSGFWEWTDVAVDRSFGFSAKDTVADMPYNVDHATDVWSPRTIAGSRKMVDQSEVHTTLLDFYAEKRLRNPFIWTWDMDDPVTYPREVVLVTNNSLPPGSANDYPSGQMDFDFLEHMR